jgi:hypothetical protein
MRKKKMIKSKTFWTGVITVVTSSLPLFGIPVPTEALTGLLGLMGIFLRKGVEETKNTVTRF